MLLQPRWLVRHVLLIGSLTGCFLGARWQLGRALERDSVLNWLYTTQWVLFGLFALLCWGWFLRDERRDPLDEPAVEPPVVYQPRAVPVSDEEDPELAAYNRYLADLDAKAK